MRGCIYQGGGKSINSGSLDKNMKIPKLISKFTYGHPMACQKALFPHLMTFGRERGLSLARLFLRVKISYNVKSLFFELWIF